MSSRRRQKLGILHSNFLFDKRSVPMNAFTERTRSRLARQIEQTEQHNHVCERCGVRFSSAAPREFACPVVLPGDTRILLPHRISTVELRTYLDEVDVTDEARCFAYIFLHEDDDGEVPACIAQLPSFTMNGDDDDDDGAKTYPFSRVDYRTIVARSHRIDANERQEEKHHHDEGRGAPVKKTLTDYYDWDPTKIDKQAITHVPICVFPLFRSDSACNKTCAK